MLERYGQHLGKPVSGPELCRAAIGRHGHSCRQRRAARLYQQASGSEEATTRRRSRRWPHHIAASAAGATGKPAAACSQHTQASAAACAPRPVRQPARPGQCGSLRCAACSSAKRHCGSESKAPRALPAGSHSQQAAARRPWQDDAQGASEARGLAMRQADCSQQQQRQRRRPRSELDRGRLARGLAARLDQIKASLALDRIYRFWSIMYSLP